MTAEETAKLFHDTYARIAPSFRHETRKASAVPWDEVPERHRRLMIAVVSEVEAAIRAPLEDKYALLVSAAEAVWTAMPGEDRSIAVDLLRAAALAGVPKEARGACDVIGVHEIVHLSDRDGWLCHYCDRVFKPVGVVAAPVEDAK